MKKISLQVVILQLLIFGFLAGCNRSKVEPEPQRPTAERAGLFVLSEGLWGRNNSTLTYYDYTTTALTEDQFSAQNKRGLGDTANDIAVYGSKMYIVVNVSSTVEVVEARTAKSIKQIDMKDNGTARQPRHLAFHKSKAFISSYDGTVAVLDTATLQIEKYIVVGRSPEQMVVSNNKLFVTNSGGMDFPNFDNTVSVIDLNTLTETTKITVGLNPGKIGADAYGDVYVVSAGNYNDVPASLTVIDDKTNAVKAQLPFAGGQFVISGDYAYMAGFDGKIGVFNLKTETLEKENFITDGTVLTAPNGIDVDEISGEVFVADAKDYTSSGEVVCFDKAGARKYALRTGILPKKVVFVNK